MTEDLSRGLGAHEGTEAAPAEGDMVAGREAASVLIGQAEVAIGQPAAGETVAIVVLAGQRYVLGFDPSLLQIQVVGADLILIYPNGGQVVFQGLGAVPEGPEAPVFEIAGAPVPGPTLFALAEQVAGEAGPPAPFLTALPPGLAGTGETRYDDDTGQIIDLLDPQGVIPPVELLFSAPLFEDVTVETVAAGDDRPNIGDVTMINDETRGLGDETPSDDTDLQAPLPEAILALELTPLNTSKKLIGFEYGADGPGGIALDPVAEGTDSGLVDTATGDPILLFNGPDGTIVGRVGSGGGPIAFVAILEESGTPSGPDNASTADLWFVQYRGILHDNPFDPDEVNPEGPELVTDTITFEGLATGAIVDEVFTDRGFGPILVNGVNPNLPDSPNEAVIFDSANPTGGDTDLGTPNVDFGGPGAGVGGELGGIAPNNVPLGNMLIVANKLTDTDPADGLVDNPNDARHAGTLLSFDFSALGPVTMESITVLDIEPTQIGTITLFDGTGIQIGAPVAIPMTGNNGVAVIDLGGTAGVATMVVLLNGSGAVDNIVFTHEATFVDEFVTLGYTVSDVDGDSASGTATITVEDDGPEAVAELVFVDEGSGPIGTGTGAANLLANDDFGADGPAGAVGPVITFSYTGEDGTGGAETLTVPAGLTVPETFIGGELTVNPNGSWVYEPPAEVAGARTEVVSYTIQDGDGDRSTVSSEIVVLDTDVEAAQGSQLGGTSGVLDVFSFGPGDAAPNLAAADVITGFEDGTDLIGLDGGLGLGDVRVGSDGAGNAVIATTGNQILATLLGIDPANIDNDDFTVIPTV